MSVAKIAGTVVVTAFTAALVAGCSSAKAGEDAETSSGRLLAGTRLSERQVAHHLRQAGFPEYDIGKMVCTAFHESSFYTRAVGDITPDYGLFQISDQNFGAFPNCPDDIEALFDPGQNARCAHDIYSAQGLKAWFGYSSNREECNGYPAPDSDGSGASAQPPSDGGCYSATLGQNAKKFACVQSKASRTWFQCKDSAWAESPNGLTKDSEGKFSGPHGPCEGEHPLP